MTPSAEQQIWSKVLMSVERRINRHIFDTWFRPIQFEGCDHSEGVVKLHAPSKVSKDWISSNYSELLNQSLKEMNLGSYRFDWSWDESETNRLAEESALDELEEDGEETETNLFSNQSPAANGKSFFDSRIGRSRNN
jgi:chromosomal replication initiation ATPase DnaA